MQFSRRSYLALMLTLGLAQSAAAVDGVIEINQAKALAGGVTTTDAAGFPVTLDASGSYRLTGDLTLASADTTGINVVATDVTIDMNGFGIIGPTVCTGTPVTSCTPSGNGDGISAGSATTTANVWVHDGTIRGVGRFGMSLSGHGSRAERVRALSNGSSGIGVNAVTSSLGGSVTDCTAVGNGLDGIFVGADGFAQGNVAVGNGRNGLRANSRSTAIDNTLNRNMNEGLNVASSSGYANNVITDNNMGSANPQVSGLGLEMGPNVCGTNLICP